MSTHTPGPWTARAYPNGWQHVVQAGRQPIAELADGKPDDNRANASLIAAAPDLLAALERYIDLHLADCVEVDEASDLLKDARAAIARAEG